MAQLRERHQLREHEVEERFREIVDRERRDEDRALPTFGKRPIRWMQWLAGFVVLAMAAGVTLFLVLRDGDTETTIDTAAPPAVVQPEAAPSTPDGYWNPYLNEWVLFDTIHPYPDGYWNSYLNVWVPFASIEMYEPSPDGYWNPYLNEWIPFDTIEPVS